MARDTILINNLADLAAHFGQVQVPAGKSGSVEVRSVVFGPYTPWPRPSKRPPPGEYTEMLRNGESWMSSYPDEFAEALPFLSALNRAPRNSPTLMLGLGLGVLLRGAMLMGHRGPIDVVEVDHDVIALVAPHWREMATIAGCELRIHLHDAYTWPGAKTGRWAIGYADIWPTLSEVHLPHVEKLAGIYAPRCVWFDAPRAR